MRLVTYCYFFCFLSPFISHSQEVNSNLQYLAQTPPSLVPEVFAPGLISKTSEYEFGSVFNKEATAFFYGVEGYEGTEIRFSELIGEKWSEAITILSHEKYGFNDPFLSNDEKKLYFISRKEIDGSQAKQDHDIWYVEKRDDEWSEPINAGSNINSPKNEYYISFSQSGTMYFSSNKISSEEEENDFDIYYSKNIGGEFQKAVKLGDAINTSSYEADVFIAPDESYIIFCARRPDGLGRGDLYISFKNREGNWTKSINMGNEINTKGHELCPFVSKDGKYLFYTSNKDIYWVSTEILSKIKDKSK